MTWNQSDTIGLAKVKCVHCEGTGLRPSRGKKVPCNCVYRAAFRACLRRFRECVVKSETASTITLDFCRGREGRRTYSRKHEEYMADFCLIAKRTLTDEEHRVFRVHFLLGADWRLCCRQLKTDRGTFFHIVYNVERKLGRAFAETQPYSLYPVADYFAGSYRMAPGRAMHSTPDYHESLEALPLSA